MFRGFQAQGRGSRDQVGGEAWKKSQAVTTGISVRLHGCHPNPPSASGNAGSRGRRCPQVGQRMSESAGRSKAFTPSSSCWCRMAPTPSSTDLGQMRELCNYWSAGERHSAWTSGRSTSRKASQQASWATSS